MNYIEYIHNDTTINTVDGFVNQPFSIVQGQTVEKFLSYKGDTDKTNRQRIEEMYIGDETYPLLKPNTRLLINIDESNREIVSVLGKDQVLEQRDFEAFLSDHLVRMLIDNKYVKAEKYDIYKNLSVIEQYPNINVWIWVRSLNKIINITNHIISLSTDVSKGGGAFSIEISPVVVLESSIETERNSVNDSNIYRDERRDVRNNFFFHKNIQANDVVFIKFEELEISEEDRKNQGFEISKSSLPNQVYDMIGLVDSNKQTVSPQSNDVSISISGRDLMKLLIEDSDYFIPQLFTIDAVDFYMNNVPDDRLLKRNFVSGTYRNLFSYSYRKISDSIQFIFNQCSHLGIIKDSINLFEYYGNRRSRVYRLEGENSNNFDTRYINKSQGGNVKNTRLFEENKGNLNTELHQGIWQIIKLEIDSQIDDRRIVDFSISQPDGNLLGNINKICQDPFVEFYGDTYGDMYSFIVRQPPFTKSQIIKYIDGQIANGFSFQGQTGLVVDIYDEDILSETFYFDDREAISWYQLTPKELNIMNNNSILSYFPIIFLPEYAEVWGNRKMDIVDNYASYDAIRDKKQDVNLNLFVKSAANDFKYVVESTMYLPFTRKGVITLNGDRRIKRGTWIRHNGTGELCYVDFVRNEYEISNTSIDRTTTIEVSRCMIEKYIKGANETIIDEETGKEKSKMISYFDIINTELVKEVLIQRSTVADNKETKAKEKYKTSFLVDKDIFNFFLKRKQFK